VFQTFFISLLAKHYQHQLVFGYRVTICNDSTYCHHF